jgi:Na+-transporting NADH:ubiquinone oxidoreductase subunit C
MNTSSNGYVMGFAIGVCVVISTALALTANSLKPIQDEAAELDRQKNVMMAAGLVSMDQMPSAPELKKLYAERVKEVVVNTKTGEVLADKSAKDAAQMNKDAAAADKADKSAANRFRVVATTLSGGGKLESVVLPISGKGLWSTIYGYLALEGDLESVRGVTFYKHGETPGLGGECENPQWCAQWKGKSIRDEQKKLVGIQVKKGKVDASIPAEKAHKVDGLSGATITSDGISRFVLADLTAFEGYLKSLAK